MVYKWADNLHRYLLASHCSLCLAPDPSGLNICADCRADLPWLGPGCPRCALPLTAPGHPCGHCQTDPIGLDRCIALFQYVAPVDALVQQFKFGQRLYLARTFAALLAERLDECARPDCIIPVPLHPARQSERGFNQALEIARPLAHQLDCKLDYTSCRKLRATPVQSRLTAAQRRRNLRDAFAIKEPLQNVRHVALVDDVMTTGSTLAALASVLRGAGVEYVEAWVCARTLSGHSR